ncbi:HAMP domain-containing sensor histidine kinase [Sphaerotilus sp.]|uniref:sensor histidine kinase n=1 Tax=Sphaerotilus sp. TaxID=2093942 RepID=UPI002ACDB85B|nr:HAMP domain-containing sensor histidine kinase [Sphaerotilus sp.]MDZ7855244.1 HAMP domain-containing sensor histidine kinase [Sphaerotilus sp.]
MDTLGATTADARPALYRARLVRLAVAFAALLLALPVVLGLLPLSSPAQPSATAAVTEIRRAAFTDSTGQQHPDLPLPDTWTQRGQPAGQPGRYTLRFTLTTAPGHDTVWALHAERLSNRHAVRLNGRLVADTLGLQPYSVRRPVPVLLTLPGDTLHTGENTLDITVQTGERAGLSPVEVGPMEALLPRHHQFLRWYVDLPRMLNAAGAGIALFMLLLWLYRRHETLLGSFGAVALLACLRNLSYYSPDSPLPGAWADLLFYLAQVASAGLLGLFAMARTQHRPRGYARTLGVVLGVLLVCGPVAALTGTMPLARRWAYPLLLLSCLPALWLLLRHALRHPSRRTLQAQLAGWGLVLAAAAHDYAYQTGHLAITHQYALPLAVPVLVLAFSVAQLRRLMRGMDEMDRLNTALETRVAERTQALDQALQARSRFLAAASHDLRQPMATLTLLLQLLHDRVHSADRSALQALSQRLDSACAAMNRLIAGLLDLSRLDDGGLVVRRQAVALQPLLQDIVGLSDELARDKGLRLILHPTSAVVDSDPVLLAQILRNLVGNAVRYTDRGGVLVGVRPCGAQAVRIVVQDTGPGIDRPGQARLFDEFVRLRPATRTPEAHGAGLGLAIARRSADLLGATLTLDSVPGRGSRFSLVVPRLRDVSDPTVPPASASARTCAGPAAPPPPPPGSGC